MVRQLKSKIASLPKESAEARTLQECVQKIGDELTLLSSSMSELVANREVTLFRWWFSSTANVSHSVSQAKLPGYVSRPRTINRMGAVQNFILLCIFLNCIGLAMQDPLDPENKGQRNKVNSPPPE